MSMCETNPEMNTLTPVLYISRKTSLKHKLNM